eukprot:scaffold402762_cov75-Attheya_sp.AAC.3
MGVLLVDAKNAFNEGNRTMIVWTVHDKWHQEPDFPSIVTEGVTEGDPLSIFIYGMRLLPLIRQRKSEDEDEDEERQSAMLC